VNPVAADLLARISNCSAKIGVIGLGYVGLPLAHALHKGGLHILGFDIDQAKIDAIREGRNYLVHLGNELVTSLKESSRFEGTTDFSRLGEADVIIICVPTPLGKHWEPDISYILDTAKAIGKTLRAGQLVILESTTYPRTTRDDMMPAIMAAAGDRAKSLEVGRDVFGAFSPEREDPGRKSHSTSTIPKLVGGLDAISTELAAAVYRKGVATVVPVSSAEVAESAKLLENIFRSVNIALVNELAILSYRMDIDIWEVVGAAATKPYGFMKFEPGPGMGGHCLPVDPFYLSWRARQFDMATEFIELAGKTNQQMPYYCVERITRSLNEGGLALNGARVLLVGVSYKTGVGDMREAPALKVIDLLSKAGARITYHDPHVPELKSRGLQSTGLEQGLGDCDIAVIVTAHPGVDHVQVAAQAPRTLDLRGVLPAGTAKAERL
jgi:UDP-N-acetyl-D-glucosamine dehydrogenase